MIKVIRSSHPQFIKALACPEVEVQSYTWAVAPDEKFIEWDGEWVVRVMTMERVPRFCSRHRELRSAIYNAQ